MLWPQQAPRRQRSFAAAPSFRQRRRHLRAPPAAQATEPPHEEKAQLAPLELAAHQRSSDAVRCRAAAAAALPAGGAAGESEHRARRPATEAEASEEHPFLSSNFLTIFPSSLGGLFGCSAKSNGNRKPSFQHGRARCKECNKGTRTTNGLTTSALLPSTRRDARRPALV